MAVLKYKDRNGNIKKLNNVKVKSDGSFSSKIFIAVENATLSSTEDPSVNGKTRALTTYDTLIYITPKEVNGLIFNYFIDDRNQIVSYNKNFYTWLKADKMYKAVYSDTEVEEQPLVYFNDNGTVTADDGVIVYKLSSRIPDSYTKVEWGLILSPMNTTEEELIYDSGISTVLVIKDETEQTATTNNADLRYRFSTSLSIFERFHCMYGRVYAKIMKDNVEEIIYSDIIKTIW